MNYSSINAMNQSLLKKILISPASFLREKNKTEESQEEHFVFGKMVDTKLLSPEEYDSKFYIMPFSDISDALKNITRYVFDYYNSTNQNIPWEESDTIILHACEIYEYQSRWKPETKIKKIKSECENYYNSLILSKNKIIVSEEMHKDAIMCVESIRNDKHTGKYLISTSDNKIVKRLIVQFELEGIQFKGELDEVYIDHKLKTIQPIDFKTMGMPIYMFNGQFWKMRYDFQAATYNYGLRQHPKIKELLSKGYELLDFKFIVAETKSIHSPLIYNVSKEINRIGFSGGTLSYGRKIEGVMQAIERYKFHSENDQWNYPMEYYNNNNMEISI